MRRLLAAVCDRCHGLLTEQIQDGVFHCKKCGLLYAQGEVSPKSVGKHINVQFSEKDLG